MDYIIGGIATLFLFGYLIYALLKQDQEVLSKVPLGGKPPEPTLYDPEVHRKHREGQYRALKPSIQASKIIQLPKQS